MQEIRELKPEEMKMANGGANQRAQIRKIPPEILAEAIYITKQMRSQGYDDQTIITYLVQNLPLSMDKATQIVRSVQVKF